MCLTHRNICHSPLSSKLALTPFRSLGISLSLSYPIPLDPSCLPCISLSRSRSVSIVPLWNLSHQKENSAFIFSFKFPIKWECGNIILLMEMNRWHPNKVRYWLETWHMHQIVTLCVPGKISSWSHEIRFMLVTYNMQIVCKWRVMGYLETFTYGAC